MIAQWNSVQSLPIAIHPLPVTSQCHKLSGQHTLAYLYGRFGVGQKFKTIYVQYILYANNILITIDKLKNLTEYLLWLWLNVTFLNILDSELDSPEALELERRRRRRRRRQRAAEAAQPRKHRTLLVSAIDEQAKVIHVSLKLVLSFDLIIPKMG